MAVPLCARPGLQLPFDGLQTAHCKRSLCPAEAEMPCLPRSPQGGMGTPGRGALHSELEAFVVQCRKVQGAARSPYRVPLIRAVCAGDVAGCAVLLHLRQPAIRNALLAPLGAHRSSPALGSSRAYSLLVGSARTPVSKGRCNEVLVKSSMAYVHQGDSVVSTSVVTGSLRQLYSTL